MVEKNRDSGITGRQAHPKIAALGEVLWDMLPAGKQPGGAPANFAHHARRLGAEAVLVSRVGRDALGQELLLHLADHGMPLRFVRMDDRYPTGSVDVALDEAGQPRFTIHKDVAWDHIAWDQSLARLAHNADAVCFGSLGLRSPVSRTTIERFLAATRETCVRILDVNLRQDFYTVDILDRALNKATILKLNEEELDRLGELFSLGGPQSHRLGRLVERYELVLIALTRGERGSLLMTLEESVEHPGFPVEVADTVGAGDAFTAALVWGWLKDWTLDEIGIFANRMAADVCAHQGAWSPGLLASGNPKRDSGGAGV